ncbi:MAG: hypothetical protein P4L35_06945 [Ignavibacteriaceae bacterium]|nr:hypothetical protein [Ignavibacteriaceae bacterium]
MTKKNPTIATVLSLILGPVGYLYIGLNFMLSGIIITALFTFVLSLFNFPFPNIFNYLQLLVYAYFGYKLSILRNVFVDSWDLTSDDIKEYKSFGYSFVIMTNLLMTLIQFYSTIVGLYLVYKSFENGRIVVAILILVFGIALIKWVLTSVFSFLSGLLMLLFRVDKKYLNYE